MLVDGWSSKSGCKEESCGGQGFAGRPRSDTNYLVGKVLSKGAV